MNQKSDILISVVVLSQHLSLSLSLFASSFVLLFRHCVPAPHLTHILKPKHNVHPATQIHRNTVTKLCFNYTAGCIIKRFFSLENGNTSTFFHFQQKKSVNKTISAHLIFCPSFRFERIHRANHDLKLIWK